MKKIITLLLSVGCFSAVFAQQGRDYKNDRDYQDKNSPYNSRGNDSKEYSSKDSKNADYSRKNYDSYNRERAFQIEKINREYDTRIRAVQDLRRLRSNERNRIVRNLENERAARIRSINDRYNHDKYADNNYDRKNNYNH